MSPTGYGQAAKRLSGWAANLLASGLILVAGLAVGRQTLQWWQADSRSAATVPSIPAGDVGHLDRPQLLELGDIPLALRREPLRGDKAAAFATLRARGERALSRPIDPPSQPGPAEERMLSRIGAHQPVAKSSNLWEIYELEGPILLVPGIQFVPTADRESLRRRVVFWGLAVPNQQDYSGRETEWTLFSYQAGSDAGSKSPVTPKTPLPTGARVTLSVSADDGGQLIGFRSQADAATFSRQLQERLAREGWQFPAGWRQSDSGWHGKFESLGGAADVQWAQEANDLVGLITITPKP